jgi:hypothetical protein
VIEEAVSFGARLVVIGSLGLWLFGCAAPAARSHDTSDPHPAQLAVYRERASRPAAALVFSPPLLQDTAPLELSRDDRQPAAFMGYPESVAEFFYVRWDDRQAGGNGSSGFGFRGGGGSGWGDRYERRAISEKVGVLYR